MDMPSRLYTSAQVRAIDRRAIAACGGEGVLLMQRAGAAAFRRLRARWPEAHRILVACGRGNNGGDGWVVARLAREAGLAVEVLALPGEPNTADARAMREAALAAGVPAREANAHDGLPAADVVVDGVFGIGLSRAPDGVAAGLIAALVRQPAPVLALDVPSGLDADTGHAPGACVRASMTVTFIAAKRGLFTGDAPAHAGAVVLERLDVDPALVDAESGAVHAWTRDDLRRALPPRAPTLHKGQAGHVLVVGGDEGYGGAVRLAAEAAARSGAGLVSVATRGANVGPILAARPELMPRPVEDPHALAALALRADVLAIGPGLGQGDWGRTLFDAALALGKPCVLDADALNLLAAAPRALPAGSVLTPHPGEAARLLGSDARAVNADRFAAAAALAQRHAAVVLLKGAGTVIAAPDGMLSLCPVAEPGMATGGMGDVLTGVVAALRAQGLDAWRAAGCGALAHARAAASAARAGGARGLLAGDVIDALRRELNP
ncbi:MAG: NAD(P)H-hydrate dehydratase [Xanthomonadaceae bacterium]|nr:NAD(P)H-hydrate dehydratase [Xanthomonadaceae bacterium]